MDKSNNPLQVVAIRDSDHRPPVPANGGSKVFGDGASEARRKVLSGQIDAVYNKFLDDQKIWPDIAGVAKVVLKDEALAKSHRPTTLFTSRYCPIIGTLDYGELLISVTETGIKKIKSKILSGRGKVVTANISAIQSIEPYSEEERLGTVDREDLLKVVRSGTSLKIHLFDHKRDSANESIRKALFGASDGEQISLEPIRYGSATDLVAVRSISEAGVDFLSRFIGIRSVSIMPSFRPVDFHTQISRVCNATEAYCPPPVSGNTYPTVGLFDSGICPNNTFLAPWIEAQESFVPPGSEDYGHGTMVAGLIVNSRTLNHCDSGFPETQARLVDVNIFPKGGSVTEDELIAIIENVVPRYPQVKVWNLSLGGTSPVQRADFSDFGRFIDEMHDRYGCLFVVAAGNQNDPAHWPTFKNNTDINRISSPGDSVRALTVGSIAHKDNPMTLVHAGEPSPFSRIGPGPCYIPKPEVNHFGGNNTATGVYAQTGVLSCGPNNGVCEAIGTSFAAPIVSSIAGALFQQLDDGVNEVPPERVKALLIHSALMALGPVTTETINNYGFGTPASIQDALYCDPNCMTLLFETDVKHGGFEFERVPVPLPDCLYTSDGKFKGEVTMTLVYSPLTDKNYASEYCRTNVSAGMGSYDSSTKNFSSKVPVAPKDYSKLYEKAQIANGFKWSPVKAYQKKFPKGVGVDTWRLVMKVTRRAEEVMPSSPQRATLVISVRGLGEELPVYNEMIAAMRQAGWVTNDVDQHIRIRSKA